MDLTAIAKLFPSPGTPHASLTVLRSRYRGVLLGVAVGNLLGLPVEAVGGEAIRARFPNGLMEIDPSERSRAWDDDLAQTALLAEALLATEGLDPKAFAARLVAWANTNGRGIGILTQQVINELARGVGPADAARKVWEAGGRRSAGNGAVMRCAPVAMRWRHDLPQLFRDSIASAQVTHADPRCQWSTVAVNVALALLLEGEGLDLEAIGGALARAGAPGGLVDAVGRVTGASLHSLALDDPDAMGYTFKAMQAGLWAVKQPGTLEETLVRVVSAGGDTDTNGAVAGALLGARFGEAVIPARWTECIGNRPSLERLAERLLERSLASEGA